MKEKGFTLVELLVVIAVAVILLGGGAVSLLGLRSANNLTAAADTVRINLEKSRLSSLVKEDGYGYGLKFNETDIILFRGSVYDPSDAANKAVGLPPGTQIQSVDLAGGGTSVSFNNLSGTTTPGTVVVALINDPAKTRTIYIDGSGRVFSSLAAPAGGSGGGGGGGGGGGQGQQAASGQQDFDLGWSIQTTSELSFDFSTDPPQTEIFIMEPHFNGDRSVFDFVAYFSAGGVVQRVRIYSNQLDASNTILSITRDPDGVNLPLEIAIDNRTIVTYYSDGTMTVGSFGGTVINQ